MSNQFFVRFKAHLKRETCPESLPKELFNDIVMEVGSLKDLKERINAQMGAFISMQAFLCWKSQETNRDQNPDELLVPFHMISHIDTEVKQLTEAIQEDVGGLLQ